MAICTERREFIGTLGGLTLSLPLVASRSRRASYKLLTRVLR
jgi:hypothetical protein